MLLLLISKQAALCERVIVCMPVVEVNSGNPDFSKVEDFLLEESSLWLSVFAFLCSRLQIGQVRMV